MNFELQNPEMDELGSAASQKVYFCIVNDVRTSFKPIPVRVSMGAVITFRYYSIFWPNPIVLLVIPM